MFGILIMRPKQSSQTLWGEDKRKDTVIDTFFLMEFYTQSETQPSMFRTVIHPNRNTKNNSSRDKYIQNRTPPDHRLLTSSQPFEDRDTIPFHG